MISILVFESFEDADLECEPTGPLQHPRNTRAQKSAG